MNRANKLLAILAICTLYTGCAMCCGVDDFTYPVFHNRYTRTNPEHGRVGSIFSDPNVGPGVAAPTNADVPRPDRGEPDLQLDPSDPKTGEGADTSTKVTTEPADTLTILPEFNSNRVYRR